MARRTTGGKSAKKSTKSRSLNPPGADEKAKQPGAPFNEQDPKRRLGNFSTAGEPHRSSGQHNR